MSEPIPFAEEGQWIRVPADKTQTIACCDCGLVHRFEFRISKGFIEWRSFRDEDATAETRRHDEAIRNVEYIQQQSIGENLPAGWIEKMGLTERSISG